MINVVKAGSSWILENSKIEVHVDQESLECNFILKENGSKWRMNLSETAGVAIGKPHTMKLFFWWDKGFDPSTRDKPPHTGNVIVYPFKSSIKSQIDGNSVILYFNTYGVDYRCEFSIDGEKPDVLFSITPLSFGEKQLLEAWFPGNMEPLGGKINWTAFPSGGQGLLYLGGGSSFSKYFQVYSGLNMPFWGAGDEKSSYIAIIETPYDSALHLSKNPEGKIEARIRWIRCMGSLNYTRRIRYSLFPKGSYVSIAKRYREYVISKGRFKSLKEKIKEKPVLKQVIGSVITFTGIPVHDESVKECIEEVKKLKELGCEKTFVFPIYRGSQEWRSFPVRNFPSREVRDQAFQEIKKLGFLAGGWLLFYQISNCSVHYTPEMTVKNTDGSIVLGWRWPNPETLESCDAPQVCSIIGNEIMKKWEDEYLMADGFHYDTGTCGLVECHDSNHPHDREIEARKRVEMFQYLGSKGKILSSECFGDYAVSAYDITTSHQPPRYGRNNRWGEFEDTWTIPLVDLVYHDSIMTNWHESSSYMSIIGGTFEEKFLQDILYNHPPLICLDEGWTQANRGIQKQHVARSIKTIINDAEIQRRAKKSFEVASLHKRLGLLEMVDHQFLSEDGSVQKTTFENGVEILVNFSEKDFKVKTLTIPAKSWRLIEAKKT